MRLSAGVIAVVLLFALATPVCAQGGDGGQKSACQSAREAFDAKYGPYPPAGSQTDYLLDAISTAFTRHDLNCDAVLQFDEWWSKQWEGYAFRDADRNGSVSLSEFAAPFCAGAAARNAGVKPASCERLLVRPFRQAANGHREIDRQSYRKLAQAEFKRWDRNRDGVLQQERRPDGSYQLK